MEITKTGKVESNDINEITHAFNKFMNVLKEKVENTTYKGKPIYRFTNDPIEVDSSDLSHIGIRDIKRFKRYLNKATMSQSMRSINRLLNLVYKRFLGEESVPRFVCDKHEIIQKLRKEWKTQQMIADQMLKQYKLEKSDFYKTIEV